ncbi:cell division cycle- protein [Mortierella alpina]|uniref:M-phase inducer phosphatase n=1 Tax=Mortierella alpina TaxID=64518 RepID=A0A9P6M7D3_MORAP|nr:cell division cycle- protein [Mortierella alpina]
MGNLEQDLDPGSPTHQSVHRHLAQTADAPHEQIHGNTPSEEEARELNASDQPATLILSSTLSKRPLEGVLEQSKRAKTLLDLSARGLEKRATPPTAPSLHRQVQEKKRSVFNIAPETVAMAGRSFSEPAWTSQSADLRIDTTNVDPASSGPCDKSQGKPTEDSKDLSEDKNSDDKSQGTPAPRALHHLSRAYTMAGPSAATLRRINSTASIVAPFSSRALLSKTSSSSSSSSSKSAHSAAKRLGHSQSLLKQTVLVPPFRPRLQPLSSPSDTRPVSCSSPRVSSSPEAEMAADEDQDPHEALAADYVTTVETGIETPLTPAVASCTAAMTSLSPPSAKIYRSLNLFGSRPKRPSFLDCEADASTVVAVSNSLPLPHTTAHFLSELSEDDDDDDDDDDDHHPILSHSNHQRLPSPSKNASRPVTSLSLSRPTGLRRHQTMISSRSEFMRTLESGSGSRRGTGLYSIISNSRIASGLKYPSVFAPKNYVPSPDRLDCQILPCEHFDPKPDDTTKRISPETVVNVLEGKFTDQYDLLYIVDCRFPYEFEGGHIKSAVNVNTTDELEELLLQPAITDKRVLLIFHCEFSSERGPRMARHLRNQDRAANASHYPAVFYPEVYVMKGGYSTFFQKNKSYCWPEAYVEMQDEKHSQEFETHRRNFQREFSRTASKGFLGMESKKNTSHSTSTSTNISSSSSSSSTSTSFSIENDVAESGSNLKDSSSTTVIDTSSSSCSSSTTTTSNKDADCGSSMNASKPNAFTQVLSSIKEAALSGSRPSPLSLPVSSSTLKRSTSRPSSSSSSLASLSSNKPSTLDRDRRSLHPCPSTVLSSSHTTTTTTISSSSSSHTSSNPFFSGFRQTKPGFGAMSPAKKDKPLL